MSIANDIFNMVHAAPNTDLDDLCSLHDHYYSEIESEVGSDTAALYFAWEFEEDGSVLVQHEYTTEGVRLVDAQGRLVNKARQPAPLGDFATWPPRKDQILWRELVPGSKLG